MTKPTFETLNFLSIADLKRLEYIGTWKTGEYFYKSGKISWKRNGEKVATIFIKTTCNDGLNPVCELSYSVENVPYKYEIQLHQTKSNLGKGSFWLFVCSKSGDRCRKLYLYDGVFQSRSNLIKNGVFYQKQLDPKKYQISAFGRWFDFYEKIEEGMERSKRPFSKPVYRNKDTKWVLKLEKIAKAFSGLNPLKK
jgi:hypothetical protein